MDTSEIEMMAAPLEVDITEKPIRIELPAQLRAYADTAENADNANTVDNCPWSLREMLRQAATEIERLQRIVNGNDPVALLREIWKHHQPVYLFETIPDQTDQTDTQEDRQDQQ